MFRNRHLPPSGAHRYSDNIGAGATVTALEARRDSWNGIIVYGRSDQDLLIHVDSGTEFGGSIVYSSTRTMRLRAGAEGDRFPVEVAAEWIRVRLVNPGASPAEQVRVGSYLATVGMIPTVTKPLITLWDGYVIPAGSGQHYSPVVDLSAVMTGRFFVQALNGTPGPSIQASCSLQVSPDGVLWHDEKSMTMPSTAAAASSISSHGCTIDWRYARIRCGGNSGQPITVSAKANLVNY